MTRTPAQLAADVRDAFSARDRLAEKALAELQTQAEAARTYGLALLQIRMNGEDTSGVARAALLAVNKPTPTPTAGLNSLHTGTYKAGE